MSIVVQPDIETLSKVVDLLARGEPVAIPTETVYGLAADATNASAIKKIYQLKNRPSFNPLISHYYSLSQIDQDVVLNETAIKLAESFWPGPLTLVLPKKPDTNLDPLVTSGLSTAAVRIPKHKVTQKILELVNKPLAAPSANPSGRLSPSQAEHVARLFPEQDLYIVDGGSTEFGLESTIVEVLADGSLTVLRYGFITEQDLKKVIPQVRTLVHGEIKAPGMLLQHYSPTCPLRLTSDNPRVGEALISFGDLVVDKNFSKIINLSEAGDLQEAAANLFEVLHQLEAEGVSGIAVMPIPDLGIGKAINDRLRRAAQAADLSNIG